MELIRFWNTLEIKDLDKEQLNTEKRCQKALRATIWNKLKALYYKSEHERFSRVREDRIEFFESYIHEIDALIAELEERIELVNDKSNRVYMNRYMKRNRQLQSFEADGIGISWDREKFMLLARDRGYLSEQSITAAVAKELGMDLARSKTLLNRGKFTWGQVMCVGALLKMNPKEFCDIFLSGYFVEHLGEYIASYKNLDKSILLQKATVPSQDNIKTDTALDSAD